MKLTALFTSPSIVVRSVTWLTAFLLLTVFWILLLRFLPLDGLFHHLGNIGMTGTQSVMAITLLPPLAMSLLSWIGLKALTPPAMKQNPTLVQATPEAIVAPVTAMLGIAAWSVLTPFGDASATVEGSQGQEKIFRPDKSIRNTEGHPVHAATIEKLPLELLNYPLETRSRAMRVSAMLVTVLNALFEQQDGLAQSTTAPAPIYWLVPGTLPLDNETRLCFATAWTHSYWCDASYDLHLLSAVTESAYGTVNALQKHMSKNKMPYVLLLAADSLVSPDELESPLALGHVFSNEVADGFVPAEGAAGLMLADASFAADSQLSRLCTLGPAQRELRTSDRNPKGKVDAGALTICIADAITAAKATIDNIGSVISDTDHRFPRNAEVTQAMEKTLPGLDSLSDRITPMAFAGYFGAASDLIHMALAAEMATTSEQAALLVSVADARQTAAMVILPGLG